jgi:sulfonate transport system substrate-binding protein
MLGLVWSFHLAKEIAMLEVSRRQLVIGGAAAAALPWMPSLAAAALGPKPPALPQPVKLTVGLAKVAHLAPVFFMKDDLTSMGVEMETADFVRYADARTALASGSLDISTVGPPDLPIVLSQGLTSMVALLGVGTQPKYMVIRKGVKIEKWSDLSGKRVGIAPGSTVWFQFAAMLEEVGVPYNSLSPVNIQGGGPNFLIALRRSDIDVAIIWEPFESQAVMEGIGEFNTSLDYSKSKAVGADLGIIMATTNAVTNKREAVRRFIWAYAKAQKDVTQTKEKFAQSISQFTGIAPDVAARVAAYIELKPELSLDQMKRQAAAFHKFGVIPKDVSGELDKYYPADLVAAGLKGG